MLNDNAEFDYGDFTLLEEVLGATDVSYNTFVHEFSQAGKILTIMCVLSQCWFYL